MSNRYDKLLDIKRSDPLDLTEKVIRFEDTIISLGAAIDSTASEVSLETRSASLENFMDFPDSYLIVKHKLTKADGTTATTTGDDVTLPNVWGALLQIFLDWNGAPADNCMNPFEVSNLNQTWEMSAASIARHGLSLGFYPTSDTSATPFAAGSNSATRDLYDASGSVYSKLYLRTVLPILSIRKALRGVHAALRLVFNTAYTHYMINAEAGYDARVVIEDIKWVIPSIRPTNPVYTALSREAASGVAIPFNYQGIIVRQYINLTDGNINVNVQTLAKRPRLVLVRPTLSSQRLTKGSGPINSYPLGLTGNCQLTVNERLYPAIAYNYAQGGHREYEALCRAFGKDPLNPNAEPFITFEMFKTSHFWLAFDVSFMDDASMLTSGQSGSLINFQGNFASVDSTTNKMDLTFFIIHDEMKIGREIGEKLLLTLPAAKLDTVASL